ncbi:MULTISPECIES: hypothetical protein [unclassified Thioalkalivibrio]|uniref:hypothetical protein n=1 Tax=unclassified Thioalkalivibrio TaxID=2621013 RepID=UPI0012DF76B1|nr:MULTISPECIES: hypothetical protein [unclassified Thioalkalivibrio]
MRLWKYKASFGPEVIDLITNKRLFCAPYNWLNDPLVGLLGFNPWEGFSRESFDVECLSEVARRSDGRRDFLDGLRVCSLSIDNSHPLMWVHYANSFRGVAVEVEIPDDHPRLYPVEYPSGFAISDDDDALTLLRKKQRCWHYESEYRLIGKDSYVELERGASRIIFGDRISPAERASIEGLCRQYSFGVACATLLGDGRVKIR